MSKWTHSICVTCWNKKNPSRPPVRVAGGERDECCFCGDSHCSGIYIREDGDNLLCKGIHKETP